MAMKDSGVAWIGEIPERWEVTKFKKVFSFGRGLPITKADLVENGIPVINYGQIHSKQNDGVNLIENLIKFVSPQFLESNSESLLKNEDFVFADTSEDYDGIGNAIFVKYEQPIFAGYHTVICRPRYADIDKYYAYLFTTDLWRDQLRQRASGIKVFSITQAMLSDVFLLTPPLPVQQKISAFLDRKCAKIDSILAAIQKSVEKLKEYRQAVITRAVTRGLDPDARMKDSGVEWIGEIPDGWEVTKIKNLYNITLGKMLAPEKKNDDETLEKYLCAANIGENGLNLSDIKEMWFNEEEKKIYKLEAGDLLVVEGGNIGLCCQFMGEIENCYIQNALHKVAPKGNQSNRFLYYWMKFIVGTEYLNLITNKATIAHYTKEKFASTPIAHVPYGMQKVITAYLDDKTARIDALIAEKQKLYDKLTEYRKSLIYEYVTGKREVGDG